MTKSLKRFERSTHLILNQWNQQEKSINLFEGNCISILTRSFLSLCTLKTTISLLFMTSFLRFKPSSRFGCDSFPKKKDFKGIWSSIKNTPSFILWIKKQLLQWLEMSLLTFWKSSLEDALGPITFIALDLWFICSKEMSSFLGQRKRTLECFTQLSTNFIW